MGLSVLGMREVPGLKHEPGSALMPSMIHEALTQRGRLPD